jgi:hypothetical protein
MISTAILIYLLFYMGVNLLSCPREDDVGLLKVYETEALTRLFGHTAGQVTKIWNVERRNLQSSPNIIRVSQSGLVRPAEHVPRMEYLCLVNRIILKLL